MKLKPSAQRTLAALQSAGPNGLTTSRLCQPYIGGVRFGARVLELRQAGHVISEERERPGSSRYRLISEPNVETVTLPGAPRCVEVPSGPASLGSSTLERAREGDPRLFDLEPQPVNAAARDWDTAA